MAKISIHYDIISDSDKKSIDCLGIKNKDRIIINEDKLNFIINYKDLSITRVNDDYEIFLDLNNNSGYIKNKEGKIILKPILKDSIIKDNIINIKYELNDQLFELILEYKVIE